MDPHQLIAALHRGDIPLLCQVPPQGLLVTDQPRPKALLCGSFNPLHSAHMSLAEIAEKRLGVPVHFEISLQNADKPQLDHQELNRRRQQFAERGFLWLTRAPKFDQKAQLFPGATFIVGADTAARIVAPCYYTNSTQRMLQRLAAIRDAGCRFLVASRVDDSGELIQPKPPDEFGDLFSFVSEAEFRIDLSSTQIRKAR